MNSKERRYNSLSPEASASEIRGKQNFNSNPASLSLPKVASNPKTTLSNDNSLVLANIISQKESELHKVGQLRKMVLDDIANIQGIKPYQEPVVEIQ